MRIARYYSHLNGYEYLQYHKPHLWREIEAVIQAVDAQACKTKISKEKTMKGRRLFSPKDLNNSFATAFGVNNWHEKTTSCWVTGDDRLIRQTLKLSEKDQKEAIEAANETPIYSYNQTDFVKERVAIEVQFGKYAFVAFDLFVKHMAFFVGDVIDLGIEILPMKILQSEMSSGVAYYEGELYNLIRQGRGVPAVPLIVIGVAP